MLEHDGKTNPTLIAFFKLFLDRAKAEFPLNSWHFLMDFWMPRLPTNSLPPSFWCKWKVLTWYISLPSFIYMWHVILEFWYFNSCLSSKKVLFQAASGWFSGHNPPNSGLIGFKFSPVIKCNIMHQIFDSWYPTVENWTKLGQKTQFLGNF